MIPRDHAHGASDRRRPFTVIAAMNESPRRRLGPYELMDRLGAGGMGEVFRARDTRLGRDVAIKRLLPSMTADEEAKARFRREARAVSAINHPGICTLYDIGEDDGHEYLVMEYLQGETLLAHLSAGRLSTDRAVQYAVALADGLAAAHARQVIHRDLKPANVMIVGGRVKILDFGVASFLWRAEPTGSGATRTVTMSVAGTPGYMAPEQWRGLPCDERTDIFALGVIVKEMLAATAVPVPPHLASIIDRCVAEAPSDRWQSAADLAWILGRSPAVDTQQAAPSVQSVPMRLTIELGVGAVAGLRSTVVLSPDGRRLAYPVRDADGVQRLATRLLSETTPAILSGTDNAQDPFFSPDGQWLGFFSDYRLRRVSVRGGAPLTLCEAPNARGASWADDGTIVVAPHIYTGLIRVPATGGTPTPLTTLGAGELSHGWPQVLPGGRVLFTAVGPSSSSVRVAAMASGAVETVAEPGYRGRYVASGHLLFAHQGTLFAVTFDLTKGQPRGVPVPMVTDLADDPGDRSAHFDIAQTGTLVYVHRGSMPAGRTIAWMDPSGATEPLLETPGRYGYLSASPDRTRLAVVSGTSDEHIWVHDLSRRRRPIRLTSGTAGNAWPQWSPDSRHVVFSAREDGSDRRSIWWARADGGAPPLRIHQSDRELHPSSVSPDGRQVALHRRSPETLYDIWMLALDSTESEAPRAGMPTVFLETPVNEWGAVFSPSGRWVAYYSEESGIGEFYVRAFTGRSGPRLISTGSGVAGTTVHWPRHGRSLFYLNGDRRIMEVAYVEEEDAFVAEEPRVWCATPVPFAAFTMTSDGTRAIVTRPAAPGERPGDLHATMILNFFSELERRVPRA
jgi:serine/threonine-protein kinase